MQDNIHAEDVAQLIGLFIDSPRSKEVYNLGGGKDNSCSIINFELCEKISGNKQSYQYSKDNRVGDHICYYSDLSKISEHFPKFQIKRILQETISKLLRQREIK